MRGIQICIDRGGTFTDCVAFVPGRKTPIVLKLLSVDPENYDDAPREGIRRILQEATGRKHPQDEPLDASDIEWIRMGTTVATNALLEHRGTACALLVTKGFRDLLHIGNQSRPDIFDLAVECPAALYAAVEEIDERVTLVDAAAAPRADAWLKAQGRETTGTTGERVKIVQPLDETRVRGQLQALRERGIESVAVCLMHSYTFQDHEIAVEAIAREVGFAHVSRSSGIMPMVKYVPRATSAVVDAYLTPVLQAYVREFYRGFQANVRNVRIEFMQSDGGLAPVETFYGFKAILSGPAGGVVGYARTSHLDGGLATIGFDMGGTSTDVSRYAGGPFEHLFESVIAGVTLQAPQLDINTVAAGGGSALTIRHGMLSVGPESVGAAPGPVCYRKPGGALAVTDANAVLGRIHAASFPHIFGPSGREPLDVDASRAAFAALAADAPGSYSVEDLALGFLAVADEAMCRPIRNLTQSKGHDVAQHVLAVFGGAGAQHMCAVARRLGIRRIVLHRYASVLSAYGLALASAVEEAQAPCAAILQRESFEHLGVELQRLDAAVRARLNARCGTSAPDAVQTTPYLHLRYEGTDCALMVTATKLEEYKDVFAAQHEREFGFSLPDRAVRVDDVRVRGELRSDASLAERADMTFALPEGQALPDLPAPVDASWRVYFDGGWQTAPVYALAALQAGSVVSGPALLVGANETALIAPGFRALVTTSAVLVDDQTGAPKHTLKATVPSSPDAALLAVMSHRFMSIAESMGRTLQKTAISTNIKERLDFSCALFGPDGGLVAHAPHLPVHLGSMQDAVQHQLRLRAGDLADGDVLVSNHPQCGGSHLPDITVVTPVFVDGALVFLVASRGHHADIGGIAPGSMPPHSRSLDDEGAQIRSLKLVERGRFDESAIVKVLQAAGTRCLADNLSDLRAQVAANHRGITLLQQLVRDYSLQVVQAYMRFIRDTAEGAVRELLRRVADEHGETLYAEDHMDDGTALRLTVEIDRTAGTAVFDFTATDAEVLGNTNAPPSVTNSAVIYCLRALIRKDMPLNQGCLVPVTVRVAPGSLLAPSASAAVVGGNVLTSQRLCDVILRAFCACAASNGCCNNFTFGMDAASGTPFGYYETIGGGAGAGPTWHGRSAVHTHMTNTRITDPEIFERRYPVVLRQFAVRARSGGAGRHRGGDGIVRDVEFAAPVDVAVLTERRVFQPYGLAGGEPGACGRNWLLRSDPSSPGNFQRLNLGGKNTCAVLPGDRVVIETPGGGGYGEVGTPSVPAPVGRPRQALSSGSLHAFRAAQESS